MSSMFGFFDLGLRALNAARLGLQIAGDNIANATTPGYAKRRLELAPGLPVRVDGGLLDRGVEIVRIRRMEDQLIQAALQREKGALGENDERLAGLRGLEAVFGDIDAPGIASSYASFAAAFDQLAGQSENLAVRREAVAAADTLARNIRSTYLRLQDLRRDQSRAIDASVDRVNDLAETLAKLNQEIFEAEVDGSTAAPLRDRRALVVEELSDLTGGTPVTGRRGGIGFNLSGGTTLVTSDDRLPVALPLRKTTDASGLTRIVTSANGADITDRLRDGRLGAQLQVRDEDVTAQLAALDALAADLTTRVNALTTGASDLDGNPGTALFLPDPPSSPSPAATIAVSEAILADPRLLAVSATGAPGDGSIALEISRVFSTASAALDGKSPSQYFADGLARLGSDLSRVEVAREVSDGLVADLTARREAVSVVSLDEEAAELIKNQRSYEAAARFLAVLNEFTEAAINLGR